MYTDTHISQKATQGPLKENEILIMAMMKTPNEHNLTQANVKGCYLYINGDVSKMYQII